MRRKRKHEQPGTPEEELEQAQQAIANLQLWCSRAAGEADKARTALEKAESRSRDLETEAAKLARLGFWKRPWGEAARVSSEQENLRWQLDDLRIKHSVAARKYQESRAALSKAEARLTTAVNRADARRRAEERERTKDEVERRKEEKRRAERAIAARAMKHDRTLAASLRHQLERDHECPYCGNWLGDEAQLDHIYPVACGVKKPAKSAGARSLA